MCRFVVADHAIVRLAGLPCKNLVKLSCVQALVASQRLACLEETIKSLEGRLTKELHPIIGDTKNGTTRTLLLDLRRAVRNRRIAQAKRLLRQINVDVAGGVVTQLLETWLQALKEYVEATSTGEKAANQGWDDLTSSLVALWELPEVRTGILYAQPRLFRKLANVFQRHGTPISLDPKLQRTFLAYCTRMATKTSPFSTFMLTAICSVFNSQIVLSESESATRRMVTVANPAMVYKLTAALEDMVAAELPLRCPQLIENEGQFIRFLRGRNVGAQEADESIITIERSAAAQFLVACAATQPPLSWRAISAQLKSLKTSETDVNSLLRACERLVEYGLIARRLDLDANNPEVLDELATRIEEFSQSLTSDVGSLLRNAQSLIRRMPVQTPEDQAATLTTICERLQVALQLTGTVGLRLDEQDLVSCDCYRDKLRSVFSCDIEAIAPTLNRLSSILPLFNSALGYQRKVQTFALEFCAANGGKVSVFRLFSEFSAHISNAPDGPPARFAELDSLGRVHAELTADIRCRLSSSASQALELPTSFFDRWAKVAADYMPLLAPPSVAYFGQFGVTTTGAKADFFVLNKVTAGYGTVFARHALDRDGGPRQWLAAALRRNFRSMQCESEVVELIGTFGFIGQLHPRLTPRCLVYPFEASSPGITSVIPWSAVAVGLDQEHTAARLIDDLTGRPLLPINLGTMSPVHFPPFYRFITAFGPSFAPDFSLTTLLEENRSPTERQSVRYYPRIFVGPVVLSRATWCVPFEVIPPRRKSATRHSDFHSLRQWATRLGLPDKVFVTPMQIAEIMSRDQLPKSFRRLHKPFLVDWNELGSHAMFRRYISPDTATVTFAEMLPAFNQIPTEAGDARRVAEHVFEFNAWGKALR